MSASVSCRANPSVPAVRFGFVFRVSRYAEVAVVPTAAKPINATYVRGNVAWEPAGSVGLGVVWVGEDFGVLDGWAVGVAAGGVDVACGVAAGGWVEPGVSVGVGVEDVVPVPVTVTVFEEEDAWVEALSVTLQATECEPAAAV